MKKRLAGLMMGVVAAVVASDCVAGQFDSMSLAQDLGQVIGSEEGCGLSYDQQAIEAFINKKVKPDDMNFTSTLGLMTDAAAYNFKSMSPSQKTAHCAQIKRVAKSYGFTK